MNGTCDEEGPKMQRYSATEESVKITSMERNETGPPLQMWEPEKQANRDPLGAPGGRE